MVSSPTTQSSVARALGTHGQILCGVEMTHEIIGALWWFRCDRMQDGIDGPFCSESLSTPYALKMVEAGLWFKEGDQAWHTHFHEFTPLGKKVWGLFLLHLES